MRTYVPSIIDHRLRNVEQFCYTVAHLFGIGTIIIERIKSPLKIVSCIFMFISTILFFFFFFCKNRGGRSSQFDPIIVDNFCRIIIKHCRSFAFVSGFHRIHDHSWQSVLVPTLYRTVAINIAVVIVA